MTQDDMWRPKIQTKRCVQLVVVIDVSNVAMQAALPLEMWPSWPSSLGWYYVHLCVTMPQTMSIENTCTQK
jgi:hypothetical protein